MRKVTLYALLLTTFAVAGCCGKDKPSEYSHPGVFWQALPVFS